MYPQKQTNNGPIYGTMYEHLLTNMVESTLHRVDKSMVQWKTTSKPICRITFTIRWTSLWFNVWTHPTNMVESKSFKVDQWMVWCIHRNKPIWWRVLYIGWTSLRIDVPTHPIQYGGELWSGMVPLAFLSFCWRLSLKCLQCRWKKHLVNSHCKCRW